MTVEDKSVRVHICQDCRAPHKYFGSFKERVGSQIRRVGLHQMQILVRQGNLQERPQILQKLVENHPFTHQLDVVFTTSEELASLLSTFQTSYYRSTLTFTTVFSSFASNVASGITALSVGSLAADDVWCIDTRGILTLSLVRATYEHLGIVGTPAGSPRGKDRFLVRLDLHDNTSRLAIHARQSLIQWDARRAETGKHGWEILLSSGFSSVANLSDKRDIKPLSQTIRDIYVPSRVFPSINSEVAYEEISALFEWVGLACLESQRLHVNDTVNPYVASYNPLPGSCAEEVNHFRWTGLLLPAFIQSILDGVLTRGDRFVAITAASFDSPVSVISASGAPRSGEHVWTAVISSATPPASARNETLWMLAETRN